MEERLSFKLSYYSKKIKLQTHIFHLLLKYRSIVLLKYSFKCDKLTEWIKHLIWVIDFSCLSTFTLHLCLKVLLSAEWQWAVFWHLEVLEVTFSLVLHKEFLTILLVDIRYCLAYYQHIYWYWGSRWKHITRNFLSLCWWLGRRTQKMDYLFWLPMKFPLWCANLSWLS